MKELPELKRISLYLGEDKGKLYALSSKWSSNTTADRIHNNPPTKPMSFLFACLFSRVSSLFFLLSFLFSLLVSVFSPLPFLERIGPALPFPSYHLHCLILPCVAFSSL